MYWGGKFQLAEIQQQKPAPDGRAGGGDGVVRDKDTKFKLGMGTKWKLRRKRKEGHLSVGRTIENRIGLDWSSRTTFGLTNIGQSSSPQTSTLRKQKANFRIPNTGVNRWITSSMKVSTGATEQSELSCKPINQQPCLQSFFYKCALAPP